MKDIYLNPNHSVYYQNLSQKEHIPCVFTGYMLFLTHLTNTISKFYFAGANLDLSCPSGLGVISPAFVRAIFVNIGPKSS